MDILKGIALSMHLGFEGDYNPIHPHVRLQNEEFIMGAYLNSESDLSLYAGMAVNQGSWNYEFGIVSGYSNATVQPFVRATYEFSDTVYGFVAPGIEVKNGKENVGIIFGIEVWSR